MRLIDADALKKWVEEYHASNWGIPQDELIYAIGSAPTIEPTLYGYNVEHLALIAAVMAKENVTPEKAVETFRNIGGILQMIMDEQKEIIQKAVEQMMDRSEDETD